MKIIKWLLLIVTVVSFSGCFSNGNDLQKEIEDKVSAELKKAGVDADLAKLNYDDLSKAPESGAEAIKLSGDNKMLSEKNVTAGSIWKDVFAFAKNLYPEAVLVGFNNHSAKFSNSYLIPNDKFTDGKSDYWVYFFVKDKAAITDEFIDDESEAFGVLFENGELSYVVVEISSEEIASKQLVGEGWLSVDTDKFVERAKKKILDDYAVDKFISIDFDCIPTWPIAFATAQGECRLTFYDTADTGFFVDMTATTGQVNAVESVTFEDLF